jgi:predicted hydrocarbon binding protein
MDMNELMKKWLTTLLAGLDEQVDEETRSRLLEACGKVCARHHTSIEIARSIKKESKNIDEFLEKLNQQKDYWCGKWIREGDAIYSVCNECGCPLVLSGLVELSPTFCECSRGWVKAVFEAALEEPVEVELTQAIGRGDKVCKFVVLHEDN